MEKSFEFLNTDFGETYNQLRHYDNNIIGTFKMVFTVYLAVFSGYVTLISSDLKIDLLPVIKVVLVITVLYGLAMLWYILETRKYFVLTARYLNEIRAYHHESIKDQFKNHSKYFVDFREPKLFHLKSSHILIAFVIIIFNTIAIGIVIYMTEIQSVYKYILPVVAIIGQFWAIRLKLKESTVPNNA